MSKNTRHQEAARARQSFAALRPPLSIQYLYGPALACRTDLLPARGHRAAEAAMALLSDPSARGFFAEEQGGDSFLLVRRGLSPYTAREVYLIECLYGPASEELVDYALASNDRVEALEFFGALTPPPPSVGGTLCDLPGFPPYYEVIRVSQ